MPTPEARPARILLVDDNATDVALTRAALRAAKLAVELHSVSSGEAALAFLRREGDFAAAPAPDLVLLDVRMPGISVIETLRVIKSDPTLQHLPVVMLTSSTLDEDVLRSYTEHASAYMTKPIDIDSFRAVVQRLENFWFSVVVLARGDKSEAP